jgi:transcriptional regulator with XRE-family HTH domain
MRTQQDLADAAQVSLATITRLESGKPLVRRSRSWDLVEAALKWPDGYIERYVNAAGMQTPVGYLIEASELSEIEPRARLAIKDALMATLPDATVSQIVAAEAAAIKALREAGLLPPEE